MVMIWFAETTENAESLEFATVEDVEKSVKPDTWWKWE